MTPLWVPQLAKRDATGSTDSWSEGSVRDNVTWTHSMADRHTAVTCGPNSIFPDISTTRNNSNPPRDNDQHWPLMMIVKYTQWNVHYRRHFKNVWKASLRRRRWQNAVVEGYSRFHFLPFHIVFSPGPPTTACTRWAARSTDLFLLWTPFRPFLYVFFFLGGGGSLRFPCWRVSWLRSGDDPLRYSCRFWSSQHGHGRCSALCNREHVTTPGRRIAMIWLNWSEGREGGDTSIG